MGNKFQSTKNVKPTQVSGLYFNGNSKERVQITIDAEGFIVQFKDVSFHLSPYDVIVSRVNGELKIEVVNQSKYLIVKDAISDVERYIEQVLEIKILSSVGRSLYQSEYRATFIVFFSLFAFLVLVHIVLNQFASSFVGFVSESYEKELGKSYSSLLTEDDVVILPKLANQHWQALLQIITAMPILAEKELKIQILEESVANAYAVPGGSIFFTKGFLLEAESAEEILGVLAHEVGHLQLRHGVEKWIAGLGARSLSLLFTGGVFAEILVSTPYSQSRELAADTFAVDLLMEAGISPSGLRDFFSRAKDSAILPSQLKMLSTHPSDEKRIEQIDRRIERKAFRPVQFPLEWFKDTLRKSSNLSN